MLKDIVEARPLGQHRLSLRFEDGVEGEIDIAGMIDFSGVFAPLADTAYFATISTDAGTGTVTWPNGADLDPDVLYATVTNIPVEQHLSPASPS